MALWFRVNINFYCTLKNDIALGASASCNIIFLSAIKIDIALTQVPYLYSIIGSVILSAINDPILFFYGPLLKPALPSIQAYPS